MIAKEKSRLRVELLSKLKDFSDPERAQQNSVIQKKLLALPEFQKAQTIAFFASEPFEVATDSLISESLNLGKRVVLPRVEQNSSWLEFHQIQSLAELQPGCFGINCPAKNSPKVELPQIDLLIVPALAFDLTGNRLGRGGGYFDRVLKKFQGVSIGLAFDFQLLEKIPIESFDQKLSQVLVGI
jgi:5-formyltetrahydrofolate cyclo-ligase